MPKTKTEYTHDSIPRILNAATRLFAEHGFDGATTRQIAQAAGLNMATVHHHLGSKKDVYMAVLKQLYAREAALIHQFTEEIRSGHIRDAEQLRRLLLQVADMQIDHVRNTPELAWLYVRRWLETAPGMTRQSNSDAADISAFEAQQSQALFAPLSRMLRQAEKQGLIHRHVDPGFIIRGFDWLLYAYFTCGPVEGGTWRGDPRLPRNLRKFKRFIHAYLLSMLGL